MSKNRLGKGLGALIGGNDNLEEGYDDDGKIREVFIRQIEPNPYQPRQEFDEEGLKDLAQSIRENGIIQPITLRQVSPDHYQIVTGERRWRAAELAGLKKVPAIIREYSDHQMMEIALIENLQREDLNPIEEAQAYQRMMDEFDMTQEEVARKIGKSRSSIANIVRLLKLPPKVQIYVSRETITMGHARAILSLKDMEEQIQVADYIIKNNLSVRETEKYIQQLNNKNGERGNKYQKIPLEPEWLNVQKVLADYLGTKVRVQKRKDKRLIMIECDTYKDIEKLLRRMNAS